MNFCNELALAASQHPRGARLLRCPLRRARLLRARHTGRAYHDALGEGCPGASSLPPRQLWIASPLRASRPHHIARLPVDPSALTICHCAASLPQRNCIGAWALPIYKRAAHVTFCAQHALLLILFLFFFLFVLRHVEKPAPLQRKKGARHVKGPPS